MLSQPLHCLDATTGQGTYGVVHKATPKGSDRELAIKKIRMGNVTEDGVPFVGLREIKILRELNHPNVIQAPCITVAHSFCV